MFLALNTQRQTAETPQGQAISLKILSSTPATKEQPCSSSPSQHISQLCQAKQGLPGGSWMRDS